MAQQITARFNERFYSGFGTSQEVPGKYPVAINGRPYLVDELNEAFELDFHTESLDIVRQQADASQEPGEATITPEGLWRRSGEDWSHGAGQTHRDHPSSDPQRFRSSKGIDPWSRFELSLLGDTARIATSANSNLRLEPAGGRLYYVNGQTLSYTGDITATTPSFTTVTGTPAQTAGAICSDGTHVWVVYGGSNGVYQTDTGSGAASAYVTSAVAGPIAYVKGRLMVANANSIYNVTGSGALPTALFTQGNASFAWVGFAEGAGQIFAAGYAGDKSIIYRTQVKTDGTALDAPVVAGELPDGEIVRSIQGYLGYICIGSDKGVRFAQPNTNGDLVIGSLIRTDSPVFDMEPDDRFVWFGWSDYDGDSTGLGRLDLSVFTAPLTPAYASDLMADTQGTVTSIATFQSVRVFAIDGSGVWTEQATKVSEGTIDSGSITYGFSDPKVALFVDVACLPLVGTISGQLDSDAGQSFPTVGTLDTTGAVLASFQCNELRARDFEVRITLTAADSDDTEGPTLNRWTLRAYPAPPMGQILTVPLYLHSTLDIDGVDVHLDVADERARFNGLLNSRALVTYQEGSISHTVFIDGLKWIPHHRTPDRSTWEGTLVVTMKEFLT